MFGGDGVCLIITQPLPGAQKTQSPGGCWRVRAPHRCELVPTWDSRASHPASTTSQPAGRLNQQLISDQISVLAN